MKSELVVGLKDGLGEIVALEDPDWMVDGRWGLIQFMDPMLNLKVRLNQRSGFTRGYIRYW